MRKCETGEILIYNHESVEECKICEPNYYSLKDPHIHELVSCKNCFEHNAKCRGGNIIEVSQGYWRKNEFSEEIIHCTISP